jgi:hypothetical protein
MYIFRSSAQFLQENARIVSITYICLEKFLPEKLTVAQQQFKNSPTFYGTRSFQYRFHESPPFNTDVHGINIDLIKIYKIHYK